MMPYLAHLEAFDSWLPLLLYIIKNKGKKREIKPQSCADITPLCVSQGGVLEYGRMTTFQAIRYVQLSSPLGACILQ